MSSFLSTPSTRPRLSILTNLPNSFIEAIITKNIVVEGGLLERDHIEYVIKVSIGVLNQRDYAASWEVLRRFGEFERLDEALRKLLSSSSSKSLPTLPPKALIRNLSPEYVIKKQEELQIFLKDLLLHQEAMDTDLCCAFFTGTLRELAVNLQHTFSLVNANKIALNEEIARLQSEKSDLQKAVAQADTQRNAAIAQLQSCRRQLTSMGGSERDSDVQPVGSVSIAMTDSTKPMFGRPRSIAPSLTLTSNASLSHFPSIAENPENPPFNPPKIVVSSPNIADIASASASPTEDTSSNLGPSYHKSNSFAYSDSSPHMRSSAVSSPVLVKSTSSTNSVSSPRKKSLSKTADVDNLASQLEIMKMVMDQLEQDKTALQKEVKQHQTDKKILIKEFKAQRALLVANNISIPAPQTN